MTAIVGHRGKTVKRVDRRRLAPSVSRVHPLARGGFRPKGRRTPTCQAFARWLAALAAVRWSTRRSSRGASAPSALRTCVLARSACISIRGRDCECTQPIVARVSPKDAANECTFFSPRTSGSARPHPPSAASRLSHPARRRRSTTSSSSSVPPVIQSMYGSVVGTRRANPHTAPGGNRHAGHAAPVHANDRRIGERTGRQADSDRGRAPQRQDHRCGKELRARPRRTLQIRRGQGACNRHPLATVRTRACECTARRRDTSSCGLVEAVHMAGSGKVDLAPTTLALVAKVDTPTNIQVFSTPT